MTVRRPFVLASLFVLFTLSAFAQPDPEPTEGEYSVDSVYTDSVYYDSEPVYEDSYESDPSYDDSYGGYDTTSYDDFLRYEEPFFDTRSGFFIGPTIQFTDLKPETLDPDLSGDLLLFGGQAYLMYNGWLFGGEWSSAMLYELTPKYDEFSLSYGGFLTGFDQQFAYGSFSIRPALMIGGGEITQIKRRSDLRDSTGNMILERYRDESFFLMRPGISLGFQPLPFLEFRLTADYLYPFGGKEISDLKKMTYGLQILFGGAQ